MFLAAFVALSVIPVNKAHSEEKKSVPNIILIFIDDMGYGDLGCFGSKENDTPNIDRMAKEGMRFTDFYSACSVCTPSRAALMTGCYPKRVDMHCNDRGLCVLFAKDTKGLNPSEITMAELLKPLGYATMCIGKWHLGDQPPFLPTQQGFDSYYGIPYSNDMGRKGIPLPLVVNEKVVEAPAHQDSLTGRYTKEAIKFIRANEKKPFFLYMPHTMVHLPLAASKEFRDRNPKTKHGLFSAAVEEIDQSVGDILATLKELKLDKNTLIIFTSDNGGVYRLASNGPLRAGKGTTWEGGMREPCIMWWPGQIPAGKTCDKVTATFDIYPTVANLTGAPLPCDRRIDGKNIWPLMSGDSPATTPHEAFYYYQIDQLQAVRSGQWKLHLPLAEKRRNWGKPDKNVPLLLFDLRTDIGETTNVADKNPDVVRHLLHLAEAARKDLGDTGTPAKDVRPAGKVKESKGMVLESLQ